MAKPTRDPAVAGLFPLITADRPPSARAAERVIRRGGRLTPRDRVEIYRRMYWARTLDSLWEDFPGVASLLGAKRFVALATAYLMAEGSVSYTLRDLGQAWPAYLRRTLGTERPDVIDVARYEWAQIEAFDGRALPPLGGAELARVGEPGFLLRTQPYLQLLRVAYPIGEYVAALKSGGRLRGEASQAFLARRPRTARGAAHLSAERSYSLAVHRWQGTLYFKRLAPGEAWLLRRLRGPAALDAVLPQLPARWAAPEHLSGWFQSWAQLGWLSPA